MHSNSFSFQEHFKQFSFHQNTKTKCKKCGCDNLYKSGKSSVLNQKYKCTHCGHVFTKFDGRTRIEKHKKRVAVFFTYYELGFSKEYIAGFLKLKDKTVNQWIEKEEKAFDDDEYFELMKGFRAQNYYYREICKMHDRFDILDEELNHKNDHEKLNLEKERDEENERFESMILNGVVLYSREKINENVAYMNKYATKEERDDYMERMNYSMTIGKLVVIDGKDLSVGDVRRMFEGSVTRNDIDVIGKIENFFVGRKIEVNEVMRI
jgi:transposase-like protein